MNQNELGQLLVAEGLVTPEQLESALQLQRSTGGSLGAILVKLGFITENRLTSAIADRQGLETINLDELVIPEELVRSIPRAVLEKYQVMPVLLEGNVLQVATSDPTDYGAIEEVQFLTDHTVEVVLASRSQIQKTLASFYREEEERARSLGEFLQSEDAPQGPMTPPAGFAGLSPEDVQRAVIPLLVEKGIITMEELARKARELAE